MYSNLGSTRLNLASQDRPDPKKKKYKFNQMFIKYTPMIITSSLFLLILTKIYIFSFWFSVSILTYLNLSPTKSNIKKLINNLTIFELFLVLFTIFICFMFIVTMVEDYIISLHISNIDNINYFWGDTNAPGSSEATSSAEAGNPSSSSNLINSSQSTNSNAVESDSTNPKPKAKFNTKPLSFASQIGDATIMSAAITGAFKLAKSSPSIAGKLQLLWVV